MAEGNQAIVEHLSYWRWERQHAKEIRDSRAVLSYCISDLLLSESKFVGESLVALGLFDRIQIGSLEIFDQGERQKSALVDVPAVFDDGWDF